ncbi:hypothetical protein EDC04DRAFT_2902739 [Pisolithus marmoratus]|nr:hypothetical protein EDC04DRAFT_2902739 [Pisolithus marmoratus]
MEPGEILSVSLEYFKSAVLPPLREQLDIAKIKDSLQWDPQGWIQGAQGWAAVQNELITRISEEKTFEPISDFFEAVVRQARKAVNTPTKFGFATRRVESPISERSDATRPNAYLLLADKQRFDAQERNKNDNKNSNLNSWDDIAVSFEFKNDDGDVEYEDVDTRIIRSLHHIMSSDPCRRATFGVTIDNADMKFWFTCRAVTLVSKPFDLRREPEHLIHFFCSVAFANDHELGWDPTIRRVCVGGEFQYDIAVNTDEGKVLVYETTRVIFDFTADTLRGPGSRVFEVRLKSQDGKLVKDAELAILKDSWRDCDRDREDTILEQIFADLRNHKGIEQANEARKYFLTVLAAGNVMVDGKIDGADSLLRISDLPADCTSYPLSVDELSTPARTGEGLSPSFPCVRGSAKQSRLHHKIHSRLVFKDVCQPMYELRSLDTVFETFEDARTALQFLHSVKWVHCNVSAGNVLRVGRIGKLADLEYAKRIESETIHDVRTGMLGFVACEVEAQIYLFKGYRPKPKGQAWKPSFRFNPLHDVESIWWIATWVLYYHVDQDGSQPTTDQSTWFNKFFPGRPDSLSRMGAFLDHVDCEVLPTSFHPAAHEAEEMHQELKMAYFNSEKEMFAIPRQNDVARTVFCRVLSGNHRQR